MTERTQTDERIGAYRVVRTLATGDVSEVLLAKAEGPLGFERVVVLKLLLPEVQADEEQNKLFAREAAAYGRLNHANIVRLYDFFALDASQAKRVPGQPSRYPGQLVMVLEYVEGPTLHRLRRMLKTLGLQLSDDVAMHVAASVFEALGAAHQAVDDRRMPAPVIHRDVNPENVLVSWSAQVKLADFGMAKVAGLNVQSVVGVLKGTQGYMAPEQITGANVTARVDVYACAIVLWEMLAKRRAFPAGTRSQVELLRAMEDPSLPSLDELRPDLDPGLRAAMRRALEPEPEKRRVTAGEMAAVLRDLVSSDEGREKLAHALTQVRHEPKVTDTVPPPASPPSMPKRTASQPRVAAPRPSIGGAGAGLPKRRATPPVGALPAVQAPPRPPAALENRPPKLSNVDGGVAAPDDGERPTIKPVLRVLVEARALDGPRDEVATQVSGRPDVPVFDARIGPPEPALSALGRIPPAPPPLRAAPSPHEPAPAEPRTPSPSAAELDRAASGLIPDFIETVRPPPGHVGPSDDAPNGTLMMVRPRPAPDPPAPAAPAHAPPRALGGTLAMAGPPVRPVPPLHASAQESSVPPPPNVSSPPRSKPRSTAAWAIAIVLAFFALLGVGFAGTYAYIRGQGAKTIATTSASSSSTPIASSFAAVASASVAPSPSASAATALPVATAPAALAAPSAVTAPSASAAPSAVAAAVGADQGTIMTEGASPGRRIFVDEKTMGQTPESVVVKCGVRLVKIGSSGVARPIDVPCGGQVVVR